MKLRKHITRGTLLALLLTPFLLPAQELSWPVQIRLQDFKTRTVGSENLNGHRHLIIQAETRSDRVAKRLGYSRVMAWFDTVNKTTRKVTLLNGSNKPLLTLQFSRFQQDQGALRAEHMEVHDHLKHQIHHYRLSNGKFLLATTMQIEKNHQRDGDTSVNGIEKKRPHQLQRTPAKARVQKICATGLF